MTRIWRWVLGVLAGLLALTVTVVALVYNASERHLRSFEMPPEYAYAIPERAAAIERGNHLTRTRGCRGCHGDDLAGQQMWGYAVAPNLLTLARKERPATLEAAIRHGIGRDGRAMYSMPAYNFLRLRDGDLADIIAYLRSLPVVHKKLPKATLPFGIRLDIALGNDGAIPDFLDGVPPLRGASLGDASLARGEYIAMTTCNECHGFSLRADFPWEGESAPDLIIIAAYSEPNFRHLMKTGLALGERELEMMSPVARARFAYFTDQEVSDLYAFLSDMSARAIAQEEGRRN